jgi:MFS transporter, PAT family, beta-lactamase induction signal transducer AmpG
VSEAKPATTHPIVFLSLCVPFGATTGYVTVTLAYLLSHAGVSVSAVAGLIAINLVPQTWKVLWAPIVDTTSTSKRWYFSAAVVTALTLAAIGFFKASPATLSIITVLVFANSVAVSFLAMAAENLMAYSTEHDQKGRAGGWYQAGNLGGAGIGGGLALWIAQHSSIVWLPGATMAALFLACCLALFFVAEPKQNHRQLHYLETLRDVAIDVWQTAKSRVGFLALLICFLPIGCGAAANLWAAVAGDWRASADTVALVNGVLGGVTSAVASVIGGYLCDRMDRKFAYALFGVFLAAVALAMAAVARSETMFIVFTLAYAFVQGLNYASFSAVVLEAIGCGAAATKYNLYASLSNMPIAYMTIVDGWGYGRWHANGLLAADALTGLVAVAFFAAVAAATRPRVAAPAE